jgi:hypothetical protein
LLSQVPTRQSTLLGKRPKVIIISKNPIDLNPNTRMSRPKLFSKTTYFKVLHLPSFIVILNLINATQALSSLHL